MRTADFDYYLPLERIAQVPLEPRHSSRLLVMDRTTNELQHKTFWNLIDYLQPDDLLVMNDTRVIPARIFARKLPGGGKVELLLLRKDGDKTWEVLVGGSGMRPGREVAVGDGLHGLVTEELDDARRMIEFSEPVEHHLEKVGHVPLPPYIHTRLEDAERYQTVYARQPGSAAAPTAGLHFTPELLDRLLQKGVQIAYVDLHVGLDTFAPVTEEHADEHRIHSEWCQLTQVTADVINATKAINRRVIAVGTTSVRTLESAAVKSQGGIVQAFSGPTNLYILPGYPFKVVDAMITNFHLPKSTLLMLVSAFAGRERILSSYATAVEMNYRFFSFGDAMLIL
ncbi:MAG: tRNA preQ1(34) S-adenosylmethionine ribosyltransferase-isomerase QueA [Anaerolinea sp.]|nr:tRNA preQ1(34) S-adenosylmethionine ribosyltransferase-isomerase QueA [Anaerolinea sp.]